MRYKEFINKEKCDISYDKKGNIIKKQIKNRKLLPVDNLKNTIPINLRKINRKSVDYFVLSTYDENNIKNSKLIFTCFEENTMKYYNIIIKYDDNNANKFLKRIFTNKDRHWRLKIEQVNEDNTFICDVMEISVNSQEEYEIKNILENDKNIPIKILELFEFYNYNKYKIDRKIPIFKIKEEEL